MTRLDRIAALARHTVVYAVGDMLGRAMGVILVPLYASALSPEENGVISLGFAFLGFSAFVYSLGINPALIRVLSTSDPDRQSAPFSSAFWTLLGLGGVLSSLLYGFAEPVSVLVFGSAGRAGVFRLIAGVIFLDTLSEPLFTLCRARQRSRFFAGVRAAQHTLQLGLTVVLIAGMNGGPEAVFQANLVSSALALILLLPAARRTFSWTLRADLLRDLLAFGLPFVPSALALLVINLSDRFMVKAFLGLEALGVYGIAFKLGLPMLFVVRAFRSAWAPALLRIAERADAREVCARVATYFLAGAVFLVLILATYARECIILIAGDRSEDYLIGHPVIPLVALGFLFYGLYIVLTAGVYAEGKTARLPLVGVPGQPRMWASI